MEREKIQNQVLMTISEKLTADIKSIKPESTYEDLGADSLDQIEIVMALEDQFDLVIPDADMEKMKMIKDIIDYLEKKLD